MHAGAGSWPCPLRPGCSDSSSNRQRKDARVHAAVARLASPCVLSAGSGASADEGARLTGGAGGAAARGGQPHAPA
eukprot:4549130-Pleurochrysis_carterae.AAC.1